MRGMGSFVSDYEIECINHELQLNKKHKIGFDDLVKLYLNHTSIIPTTRDDIENALRKVFNLESHSDDGLINKNCLFEFLVENEGDKNSTANAELYLKELLGNSSQIFMDDFLKIIFKHDENALTAK